MHTYTYIRMHTQGHIRGHIQARTNTIVCFSFSFIRSREHQEDYQIVFCKLYAYICMSLVLCLRLVTEFLCPF